VRYKEDALYLTRAHISILMYNEGRRCPFEDLQAFEKALIELVNFFSESWLTSNSGHPLQILWGHKDILASIELAYLGCSIQKIKDISPDQLRQNIKLLKSNDRGTMAGAVWEIILAAAYHNPPNQKSRLLGPRKPTYDIDVETIDGLKTRISVKNFGQSKRDRNFVTNFDLIEKSVVKSIISHVQIVIFRKNEYPSPQEWASLIRTLSKLIKSRNVFMHYLDNGWDISITPLTDGQIKRLTGLETALLYGGKKSHTLFIAIPFYKNENKNIESNLKLACSDLIENGSIESDRLQNSLFIHLPEYVSLEDYVDWCKEFFLNNPTAPISHITLLQPAYATDPENEEISFLAINNAVIERPNNPKPINKLKIELPIGKPTNKITTSFNIGFEIPKHHYTMQSGRIYVDYGDITHGGEMKVRSIHGIIIDAIAELNGEEFSLSINSPSTLRLALL
jgi:hypothetical protein